MADAMKWLEHYQFLALWVEGIALVAIFFLDFWSNRSQHQEMVDQLKAFRDQTDAVLQNTDALMQAERGRIVVYWNQALHIDYGPTRIENGPMVCCFNWECGNAGRTQIELVKTWSRLIVIGSLLEIPQEPDYSAPNERAYVGEPLQPNSKQRTTWLSALLQTDLSFEEVSERVRSGKCSLYAYGFVEYRDVWGKSHVHRFGVVRVITESIQSDIWMPAGPLAYNSST